MKYVKFIGSHLFAFIIGFIAACGLGIVVAENIASSTVDYNKNSQATVEDALDDLYEKADSCNSTFVNSGDNFADYIISIYNIHNEDGFNNMYYHDKKGPYATYEAGDYSYRFSGSSDSVNNYVCFGSDSSTCPETNLYRIIGVFKDDNNEYNVKLIKKTIEYSTGGTNGTAYYNSNYSKYTYTWTNASNVNWSESALNTINLNTNFLAKFASKWQNYIEDYSWIAGKTNDLDYVDGTQNVYTQEIKNQSSSTRYESKIGLMYVSDYMYAAAPRFWVWRGRYYNGASSGYGYAKDNDWIIYSSQSSDNYWTMSVTINSNDIYYISSGMVSSTYSSYQYSFILPCFYLKSSVTYAGGSGTSSDPYRISE